MLHDILLAFIAIFFAVDPIGLLPIFVGLTSHIKRAEKRQIVFQSLTTATCLAVGFIFLGKLIFNFLGITIGDFMVAGGAILFCLSMMDLMSAGQGRHRPIPHLGVVPIGTPLIVGPAVLTLSLMMIDLHGLAATLLAVLLNLFLVGIVFHYSDNIMRLIGEAGARALSKVMTLLLAAIGVMMIRKGILEVILTFKT